MYEKSKNRWFKHMDFIVLDLVLLEISYLISYYLRLHHGFRHTSDLYQNMQIIVIVFDVILMLSMQMHKNILKRSLIHEILSSVKNMTILVIAIMAYLFYIKQSSEFSRMIFTLFWLVGSIALSVGRSVYKILVKKRLEKKGNFPQMMLITDSNELCSAVKRICRHSELRYQLCSIVLTDYDRTVDYSSLLQSRGITEKYNIIGGSDELEGYLLDKVIDEAFIEIHNLKEIEMLTQNLLETGVVVHIGLAHTFGELPNQIVERVAGMPVLTASINAASPVQLLCKRIMDICGALVGLVITGIAFVIFAPIIYKQSPGPIFYSQERVGRNGRRFRIYKFRSMYLDADKRKAELMKQNKIEGDGLLFKMDNDPRIIPIGHFMRRTSIDELPQFFNILKGDMSLVGTRPPTVDEWEKYSLHHRARLSFRPGLTGMWQVSGRSDITNFEEVVELDMKYIREWTLKLDIMMLLKTVQVVLTGKGAV